MKTTIKGIIFVLGVSIIGCNIGKRDFEVPIISITPTVIHEGLMVSLPGRLLADENYLYLETPLLTEEYFLNVYDIKTGEKLYRTVKKGRGPNEFTTGRPAQVVGNRIYVWDNNTKRQALFSIYDALSGKDYVTPLPDLVSDDVIIRLIWIDDSTQVSLTPAGSSILNLHRGSSLKPFGKAILEEEIENAFSAFQGCLLFHKEKALLLYGNIPVQYIALYKYNGEDLFLVKEIKGYDKLNIKDNKLVPDPSHISGSEHLFTRDYIIVRKSIDRGDDDPTVVVEGRLPTKIPQTVFIYSLDGELLRIADLDLPVLRMASTQEDNTLYAVVQIDGLFKIVKYDL